MDADTPPPKKQPGLVAGFLSACSWLGGPSIGDLIDDVIHNRSSNPWDKPHCPQFKRKTKR
jgi:hypothetical protein